MSPLGLFYHLQKPAHPAVMLHAPGQFDGMDAGLEPSERFAGSGESYFMSDEPLCLPGLHAINTGF